MKAGEKIPFSTLFGQEVVRNSATCRHYRSLTLAPPQKETSASHSTAAPRRTGRLAQSFIASY